MSTRSMLQRMALTPSQWKWLSKTLSIISGILFLILTPFMIQSIYALPFELTQGKHVRMLFLHVPFAFCSLAAYSMMAFLCCSYLIWPIKYAIWGALSLLYPCTLLTACTLLTGSLWGYPTWGTYWIWDARLTSSFIMLLTLIALITIHQLPTPNRSKINRLFTIIAIIGWINIPFVHFSVEWFQTLHQGPSLSLLRPTTVEKPYLIMVIMAIFQMILWSMSSSLFLFYRHIRISYGLHR